MMQESCTSSQDTEVSAAGAGYCATVHRWEQTSNTKRSGACDNSFLSMVEVQVQPPKGRQDKIKGKEMYLVINVRKIKQREYEL